MLEKGAVWRPGPSPVAWGPVGGRARGPKGWLGRGPGVAVALTGNSALSGRRAVAAAVAGPRGGAGGWIGDTGRATAGRSPLWGAGGGTARGADT